MQGPVLALVVGPLDQDLVPSWRTEIWVGMVWDRVPLGPFTVARVPSTVTSTPLGTSMGILPMRDNVGLPYQT